jgi:tetratricopeptide (TPR) repeat protein
MTLEEELFQQLAEGKEIGNDIPLVDTLLIADGVEDKVRLASYREAITGIYYDLISDEDFEIDPNKSIDQQSIEFADKLYTYLVEYNKLGTDPGEYSLRKTVDMINKGIIGEALDCFGMTLIYSILANELGLDLQVVEKESHVHNRMRIKGKVYDIDHRKESKIIQPDHVEGIEHDINSLVAFTYIKRADREMERDNDDEAMELYTKAITIDPKLSDRVYQNRAALHMEKGNYDLAKQDYEKAISLNPSDAKTHIGLAFVEYQKSNYDKALEHTKNAEEINTFNPDIYYVKALVLYEQGKNDDALRNSAIALGFEKDHEGATELKDAILRERELNHIMVMGKSRTLH